MLLYDATTTSVVKPFTMPSGKNLENKTGEAEISASAGQVLEEEVEVEVAVEMEVEVGQKEEEEEVYFCHHGLRDRRSDPMGKCIMEGWFLILRPLH